MKLTILCNTRINGFFADAVREYEKRLRPYCKISIRPHHDPIKTEAKSGHPIRIISIKKDGEKTTSEDLAEMLSVFSLEAVTEVYIMVGACSVAENEPIRRICLTQMDMDERLATVVLYEQIYRAYRIINGEPYHR